MSENALGKRDALLIAQLAAGNTHEKVAAASQAAASTLISLLGRETPPAVRLGAARTLLDSTCRFRETHELEERLRALEQRLGNAS